MLPFQKEILRGIRSQSYPWSEENFNRLALQSFRHQFRTNRIYRNYCRLKKLSPDAVHHWSSLPALPVLAFKFHKVTAFSRRAKAVFETSGTTLGTRRGRHFFETLTFYDAVIDALSGEYLFKSLKDPGVLSLIAPYKEDRKSSLSYMIERIRSPLRSSRFAQGLDSDGIDSGLCLSFLKRMIRDKRSVVILATTLSIQSFIQKLKEKQCFLKLPAGSRIMDTGGAKGFKTQITRSRLNADTQSYLNIPARSWINEYGMTELSSHFYDRVLVHKNSRRLKGIPGWTRVLMINPLTGKPVPQGQKGLVRIIDLANQGSVIAVQTEDEGRLYKNGFEIMGRRPGSDLRGCSLSFEELEARLRR